VAAIEDIKFITRCDVFPSSPASIPPHAIDRYYQQSDAQLQSLLKSVEARKTSRWWRTGRRGRQGAGLADDARS